MIRRLSLALLLAVGCSSEPEPPASWTRSLLSRAPEDASEDLSEDTAETVDGAITFDLDARTVSISAGASITYRVESPRPLALELVGSSASDGTLRVSASTLDAARRVVVDPIWPAEKVTGSTLEQRFDLWEVPKGATFELELSWENAAGDTLELRTLELVERRLPPPPILFVSADTLSARHLSAFGYARPTSPNLARFAEQAVTFERAIANAPWTLPSYITQFSGLYAGASAPPLDVRKGPLPPRALDPQRWTLAECLRANGYRTAAFTGNGFFAGDHRLNQGFDEYRAGLGVGRRLSEILPEARTWIDGLNTLDTPFVFINAMDAHGPYAPRAPFRGRFADDQSVEPLLGMAPVAKSSLPFLGQIPHYVVRLLYPKGEVPSELPVGSIRDAYDEEVLSLDAAIGELFDAWKQAGLWERSIVVVAADHGEAMRDHNWLFCHRTLFGEVTHVPLIVKLPHGRHAGRRIAQAVQLVDIFPTLVEETGLDTAGRVLHGRSLTAALDSGDERSAAPLISEGGSQRGALVELEGWRLIETRLGFAPPAVLITHPRAKAWVAARSPELARFRPGIDELADLGKQLPLQKIFARLAIDLAAPHYELFDLANDPREQVDVAAEHPQRVKAMRALLDSERARARVGQARLDRRDRRAI